jgi:transcription attenuation protein (tryptophan RNA-binding attenuator protein)
MTFGENQPQNGFGGCGKEDLPPMSGGDSFIVKAEENGVMVIGLTRGQETRFHHNEKLDKGEIMIFQFTAHTSAVKIRGKATIYSSLGIMESGK